MSRFYWRSGGFPESGATGITRSVALPVGTDNSNTDPPLTGSIRPMTSSGKGAAETSFDLASLAQTGQQSGKIVVFSTTGMTVGTIEANTWTVALATSEANANANSFTAISLYVWGLVEGGENVRGFIYDAATPLGVEWGVTEDGQVLTVSGAQVGGVIPTDWLVCEVWYVATQSSATSYVQTVYFDGATDVTDSTTTNAASYLETPQNLFLLPAGLDGVSRQPWTGAPRV